MYWIKKKLLLLCTMTLFFGFAGVTGATQFTLSDINNLNPDISVDLTASAEDPVWTQKWDAKPPKFHKLKKKPKIRKSDPNSIPEPATMLLLGCGLIGLAAVGKKKFK